MGTALLAGCGDDGRTLAPAPPTTATPPATVASPPTTSTLRVTSPDVTDGAALDRRFTCHGDNVAPTVDIAGVPATTAELAVVVVDLDDGTVHWVVAGLPATTTRLDAGALPPTAVLGRADTGVTGWDGPCPSPDEEPHRYELRAYATAEPLGLAPGQDGRQAVATIEAAALAVDRLMFRYEPTG